MGYIILFGWIVLLPIFVGEIWSTKKNIISLPYKWLWGQFLLWALFQVAAGCFILQEEPIDKLIPAYIAAGLSAGVVGIISKLISGKNVEKQKEKLFRVWIKENIFWALLFAVLWIFQIVMIIVLAVNDGDDAYYMAVANQAENSGLMYTANVYSFGGMELNYRYALAPFPIWIAFLSIISGIHTLTVGHIVLGILMVTMSYAVYAAIGKELFGLKSKKQFQLLICASLIYIWGNTSSHTPESFLLLRGRQGKALVAALVFPAMIYLLIKIGHRLEQRKKLLFQDYLLAGIIILTGCLGSTLGGALVIMLWASGVLFMTLGYKRISLLFAGGLSTIPGMVYVVLYLLN